MKRLISFLAAASILLLSSACTSSNEDLSSDTEVTTSSAETTTANTEETTGNTSETTTNTEAAANTAETIYNGEYEIFKGVPKAENTINTVNCKEFHPSLLCYGGGSTFFMWNGTVYKHSKDTTEPLFEKYAYNLNYHNGKLYFIESNDLDVYSRDGLIIEGFVYSYDLETNECRKLNDFPVSQLIVTEKGIFCTDYSTEDDPEPPSGIYRLDEKTGESERLYEGLNYVEYGDYHLKHDRDADGNIIRFFSDDKEEYLLNLVQPLRECINGDYYYFYSESNHFLNRLSMLTGEIISLKPYESTAGNASADDFKESTVCMDYTVLNDVIYFIDDNSCLRRYNENSDTYTQMNCGYGLAGLFSDDESLYGVVYTGPYTYGFAKITLNGDTAKAELLV